MWSFLSQSSSSSISSLRSQFLARGFATKKAGGSVKNNSGSPGQRLGFKRCHDEPVLAGNIIVRQRGRHYWEGENVGCGRDHTLFALKEGRVRLEQIRNQAGFKKLVVHVTPLLLDERCVQYLWEH